MKYLAFSCLLVSVLGVSAAAQDYLFGFSNLTNYTQQRGTWVLNGGQVQSDPNVTFQELTYDNITTSQNGAVECLCVYDTTRPGLQYMAPIIRYGTTSTINSYFMCKVQDNGGAQGFDRCWCYYYNGTSYSAVGISGLAITPPSKLVRVRLQVCDQPAPSTMVDICAYLDTDNDGNWDITATSTTSLGYGTSGNIGLNGYRSSLADDLKYFNGSLKADAPAKIGTTVNLDGCGAPSSRYQGACSFGNSGFGLGGGRAIPVTVDPLFLLTVQNLAPGIFSAFAGPTNADGTFQMSVIIPPNNALVGFTIWATAINGVFTNIFQDEELKIVP